MGTSCRAERLTWARGFGGVFRRGCVLRALQRTVLLEEEEVVVVVVAAACAGFCSALPCRAVFYVCATAN
ncbi:uncharacterized protein K452DRAFT_282360 [Aplosporella prunicola CBS 121167]|uniref:Uncharacterized protein n=1 Tax=Aplosporella prunicola CBS 121167 TaxID=1176127 RepID=A0A6A6BWX9_9PEZI|nr:uncharacterized protein K452DRAFT_282360 [Aplosporella prunicola CBS 121167]KAF2147354.1 hypothetical protein K452DRAFT_282360 [Aplosporella prunicola CBS 121167]